MFALLDGAAELLAFGAHRAHRDRLAAADRELAGRARRAASGAGVASAVIVLCTGLAVLGSTYLGAAAVAEGRLAPPMAAVLGLVPLAAAEAVALLPPAAQQWRSLRAAQARLAPLLATPEPAPPRRTPADGIELRGVRAQWPGTARAVLQDVDLHVPAGTHVAVVGPSGSGKSTLLALLLGFVPPERGEVRVPERVAWCPQEPQLVATTVRENLRVADPKATDEQLAEALELADPPSAADR
ncbi:MAG: ATP-binding cassette domain-containing protein, partial [Saccharopolyspora rectivirgula]